MATIDDVVALPTGGAFRLNGRTWRRSSGCVSHYSELSQDGERTTLYAWPTSGRSSSKARLITLRPTSRIEVLSDT